MDPSVGLLFGNDGGQGNAANAPLGDNDMPQDQDGADGQNANKALTSRYRGVCWNKKNRRWQAAINSSGKYLYLGSYMSEEEAARAFDRAAIRLRGKRSKLNFTFSDYTDDAGNLKEDSRLNAVLSKVEAKHHDKDDGVDALALGFGRSARLPHFGVGGDFHGRRTMDSALDLFHQHQNMAANMHLGGMGQHNLQGTPRSLGGMPLGSSAGHHSEALRAALIAGGFMQGAAGGVGGVGGGHGTPAARPSATAGIPGLPGGLPEMKMPPNCIVSSVIPGEDDTFGVIYVNSASHHFGSAVWDGLDLHDLGLYDSEKDARQSCLCTMRIVLGHKRTAEPTAGSGPLYGMSGPGGSSDPTSTLAHHFAGGSSAAAAGGSGGGGASGLDALSLLQGGDKQSATNSLLLSMAAGANGGGGFDGHGGFGGGGQGGSKGLQGDNDGGGGGSVGAGLSGPGDSKATGYNELFQWLSAINEKKQQHNTQMDTAALLATLTRSQFGNTMGAMGGGGGDDGSKRGGMASLGEGDGDGMGSNKKVRSSGGAGGSGGGGVSEFTAMTKLGTVRLADALKSLFPEQQQRSGADA